MTKNSKSNLVKIVYFDEQAAVDALQVVDGGTALETLSKTLERGTGIGVEGSAGKSILGILGIGLKGNAKRDKNTIIQSQVTSTLISQFLEKVVAKKIRLLVIDEPGLRIQKESNAYFRNLLPMTHMVKDFSALDNVDEDTQQSLSVLNFDQLGESLDSFSAYYELEGLYQQKPAIFRFNIDGLRNNYSLLDLAKMDKLKIYGLIVGYKNSMNLTFDKEVNDLVAINDDEEDFDYDEIKAQENTINAENKDENGVYPMIDVILAGIEAYED